MEEPNKFRRPKARLKTANATQGVNEAPSKSVSSLKTNYDLQVANMKLEFKIEKLEDKLQELQSRISELTIENTELVDKLEEYENSEELGDEPQATMSEQIIAQFAPLVPGLIDRYFATRDRDYELNMIVAKQAEERIRMQKEQGIGNG
jgi:predicted nuclease with TOPRIM domain